MIISNQEQFLFHLFSCGDPREHIKYDIQADSLEQMLVVGAMLRIHHMVGEFFNGCSDGRVFSEVCHCDGGRGEMPSLLLTSGRLTILSGMKRMIGGWRSWGSGCRIAWWRTSGLRTLAG